MLYVSLLKALNYDVERNFRGLLAGIGSELAAVRTGDTPKERAAMLKSPSDILITTPESLFMLTSRARDLRGVEVVIVDEVHAVAGSKRGAYPALSLERLERLVGEPVQRVGLLGHPAAARGDRPLRFVGRPIELVDAGTRKSSTFASSCRSRTCESLGEGGFIWPSIHPALLELVREHCSTIVFVNNCRLAERLALRLNELADTEIARAQPRGRWPREQRVEVEELLKKGEIPCLRPPRRSSSGSTWAPSTSSSRSSRPSRSRGGSSGSGGPGIGYEASKGRIFPKFSGRRSARVGHVAQRMKGRELIEETRVPRNPLDVLAQQIVAICAEEEIAVDELHDSSVARGRSATSPVSSSRTSSTCSPGAIRRRSSSRSCGHASPGIAPRGLVRGREGAQRLAVTNAGTILDCGLFGVHLVDGGGRVGELDEEMAYERARGPDVPARRPRRGGSRRSRATACSFPAPGVPGLVPF